jgi:predicted HTH transcriptional regulator
MGTKGYACGFERLVEYIKNLIPSNEIMVKATRKDAPMYPEIAIRELVANAIIHQDFSITGNGPMIEIFSDRMEITNPGIPLVDTNRFIDTPPQSRNENIASFMRRIGVCEERGSGIDKVVFEAEFYQLPAPLFEVTGNNTRVTLFAYRSYSDMDRAERVRATYMHACLRYVQRDYLTNASLRDRFGIEKENSAMVSRVIKDALEDNVIKPVDPESDSRKHARYQPV